MYRYKTDICALFTEEKTFELQLWVERELAYANARLGKISQAALEEIQSKCTPEHVFLKRANELEEETHHDIMSMVLAITEQCPNYGGYVHLGATSNDIKDTVLGLQMKDAQKIILEHVSQTIDELRQLARKYRDVVCVGRTHGQHAIPITYGFKFANYLSELSMSKQILASTVVNYGKFSGAVGNYASYGTKEIESIILERLGLQHLPITTQVISRVIHSQFIFSLITIVSCLERIAKEIRNLQRSEIGEVFESFSSKQVGSSTMPQKRNPHKSERICGLAKYLRHLVGVELENISLEHERDLTNSSSERLVIPDVVILTDYVILEMTKILKGIQLDLTNIKRNLAVTQGRICAERLMIALADKIGRQRAHELLNRLADTKGDYIQVVLASEVKSYLTPAEITALLDPETYTGFSKELVDEVTALL